MINMAGVTDMSGKYNCRTVMQLSATGPGHLINQSQPNNLGQLSDTQTSAIEVRRQYVDLILAN